MSIVEKIYQPAFPYESGDEHGVLSPFDPGTRTLKAGSRIRPEFCPLPVDIVLEKDVAVTLRDGVTIYTDVLRPAGDAKAPAIVA